MAIVALIQNLYPELNISDKRQLSGFAQKTYEKFFDVLVEESGHEIYQATTLENYQDTGQPTPEIIICSPLPEVGNLATGFVNLQALQAAFPNVPIIVWSNRSEQSIEKTLLEDYGIAAYYTGNLLAAPDDFADLILKHT